MKSRTAISFLITLFVVGIYGFNSERIKWNKHRPIHWHDFKGNPDYSDKFRDAVTASSLKFNCKCDQQNNLDVLVSAEFLKSQSWVKEVARNDYHLGHERLHFDITELFARKFRAEIEHRKLTCNDREEVQQLIYSYLAACMNYQNEYDTETYYSMHKDKQAEWENQINQELKSLERFASN